ncbi:archease [Candidatus Nitrosocosmicus arcticus]|uniref:Protein archease n=1 Tax=Candidatus Nitrosocosmicus arcticus TaxID=2035267 RepID=A0A557SW73_9ARCH|nr:archease [Candidatus Nitrosocosmicus arcticus]TVP40843.1 Protein archease [Candidatus Nitrosocosmicus arcticus]
MFLDHVEYLDHMTDAYLRIRGQTMKEAFEYSAMGLVNIMYDIENIEKKQRIPILAEGEELENLLFEWLDKILLMMLIDKVVFSKFNIEITFDKASDKYIIIGYGEGEFADLNKHELKVEIKGVTYHEMKILDHKDTNEIIIEYIVDL